MIAAIRDYWNGQVPNYGCYFHHAQAVLRYARSYPKRNRDGQMTGGAGLAKELKQHLESVGKTITINKFVRQLQVLAFLPPDQLIPAFNHLEMEGIRLFPTVASKIILLTEYFEKEWIRTRNSNGEFGPAAYPPRLWRVYETVLVARPRTTGEIERWHRTINAKVRKQSSKVYWKIWNLFRTELHLHSPQKIQEIRRCADAPTPKLWAMKEKQDERAAVLKKAVMEYDSQDVSRSLNRIIGSLSRRRANLLNTSEATDVQEQEGRETEEPEDELLQETEFQLWRRGWTGFGNIWL